MKHRAIKPPGVWTVVMRSLRHTTGWQRAALAGTFLGEAVLPLVFLVETAHLVGLLTQREPSPTWATVAAPVLIVCIAYLAQHAVNSFRNSVCAAAGVQIELALREQLLGAVCAPAGIGHLEDRTFADELTWAKGFMEGYAPPRQMVTAALNVATARARGLGALYVLATFRWWAALVLLLAYRLHDRWMSRDLRTLVDSARHSTPKARVAAYTRELATSAAAAKEIRTLGLSGWLTERFLTAGTAALDSAWRVRRGNRRGRWVGMVTLTAALAVVALGLAVAAARGEATVTELAQGLQAILLVSGLGFVGDDQWRLAQAAGCLPHVDEVRSRTARVVERQPHAAAAVRSEPLTALEFRGVRFGYPNGDDAVLRGIDLTVPGGQVTAIVGANGAGKTSLIKLLTRLYEPTAGLITANGTPISDVPLADWRARLAVIFQDFVRYEASLRDNISPSGCPLPDEVLARILELADLGAVADRLPNGLDTMLSRAYQGGSDLSGGEWQKVALARAMAATETGADIIVLDEPTASLDVRAEAMFLERFSDYARGRTAVLVSHRLATVRAADLIVVLDDGRVVESGQHDELVSGAGRYGRMFHTQAARYVPQAGEHVAASA